MVKYVIITHGPLAEAFKETLRMFFGNDVENIFTIGLYPNEAIDSLKNSIASLIKKQYTKDGLLIFLDIYGGSPFNMTACVLNELSDDYSCIECFSGVNLAILTEVIANSNSLSLKEMCELIEHKGPASIINVRKALEL